MQQGFGLVVRFTLKDGAAAGFDDLVASTVEKIRSEPGTVIYTCHRVQDRPNQRIFYELYRDRAAFQAHEEQEHTRYFLKEREQYLQAVEVDLLDLDTGKGVD